jgi:hypothetical protein
LGDLSFPNSCFPEPCAGEHQSDSAFLRYAFCVLSKKRASVRFRGVDIFFVRWMEVFIQGSGLLSDIILAC